MKKATSTLFFVIISLVQIVIFGCTKPEEGNKLPPVAEFIADTNYVAVGVSVSFTDQSTNEPTEWFWDFGDGTTSTEQNPSHTYNELGTYSIYLIATNGNGSNRRNRNRYLIVHKAFIEGTVSDYDGNTYKTVQIGDQIWMAENLKVTHYPDGTPIPEVKEDSEWLNLTNADDAFCYYDNAPKSKYGGLYTYAAACKAAPTGWHLPSHDEWITLELFIGMTPEQIADQGYASNKASKLKTVSGWDINGYGANGTNDYGFSAMPGGFRQWAANLDNLFQAVGNYGEWWTSTEWDWEIHNGTGEDAYFRRIASMNAGVVNGGAYKMTGMSVRCVKD